MWRNNDTHQAAPQTDKDDERSVQTCILCDTIVTMQRVKKMLVLQNKTIMSHFSRHNFNKHI